MYYNVPYWLKIGGIKDERMESEITEEGQAGAGDRASVCPGFVCTCSRVCGAGGETDKAVTECEKEDTVL